MRLTNAQHFRWLVSGHLPRPVNAESIGQSSSPAVTLPRRELSDLRIRAALMLSGETIQTLADAHGVSRQLISRLIHGGRGGVRGKSGTVRRALEALAR